MELIYFDRAKNLAKPNTIRNKQTQCPFCDKEQLSTIIEEHLDITWVENKFPTLKNTYMTVIIESANCKEDMHLYDDDKLKQLLNFSVDRWLAMCANKTYQSAIMFKNKGPLSGGTIKHPHMQIVGFKCNNGYSQITKENFQGLKIELSNQIKFTISDLPFNSFLEFNIKFLENQLEDMCDTIKFLLNYIEDNYHGNLEASYNLFFYNLDEELYVKIVPRYPTSPIQIGFGIKQIYNQQTLNEYIAIFKQYYKQYQANKNKI